MDDPTPRLYHYRAVFVGAYDGDSVTVDIDLGLNSWLRKQKLRLIGINAPELRGETYAAAVKSRDRVVSLCATGQMVIETHRDKTEKYGRWLARIWVKDDTEWLCVNDLMVSEGLAVAYKP